MNTKGDRSAGANGSVRAEIVFGRPVPPHPGPLPQGEGGTFPTLDTGANAQFFRTLPTILPLPEGEGRGEGKQGAKGQGAPYCKSPRLDLAAIRSRLNRSSGQQYWRSLEELAETKEFREMLHREFPEGATEWWDGLSRRNFLKMAAASLALAGMIGCTKQTPKEILPYVNQPEGLIPGEPLFYATAMAQNGFATGLLVKSREGHPVKIEGNPEHPSSLGSSSIWMQASILDLYDPDRSQTVVHQSDITTWALFLSELNEVVREENARN